MNNILAYNACQSYNLIEAFIWFGFGGFCMFKLRKTVAALKFNQMMLAIGFVAFGISDLVEIRTGSWWHPWWMLLWKATCLIVIGSCIWKIHKHRQTSQTD
ncbi:MAG: hypothetical protein JEZ07_04410 [Phycisphaerae bacterium]|nr:hypothetical protein [Phycisphaerae bacterium]